jgi:hypothetical protein
VIGHKVVETAMVLVTTVLPAGQLVAVGPQEVMVSSVVA